MPAMTRRYRALLFLGYGLLTVLVVAGLVLIVTRRPAGVPVQLQAPPTPQPLRVHVTGAVVAPGVYRLAPGSIVQDAIAAAGGPTAQANLLLMNLAQVLHDGQQVVVLETPPTSVPASTAAAGQGTSIATAASLIDINTASASELESLPRVGPALAQRIVDYRAAHGRFRAIEDIMLVTGIGPATFDQIKDLITIS
jgi:competence protein ComEA